MLRCAPVLAALLALLWAAPSSALLLTLSDFSSTERMGDIGFIDNEYLDATLDIQVSGSTVTLTATNLTSGEFQFDISQIAFSTSSNITSLSVDSVPAGWSLVASTGMSGSPTQFDGFGIHDWALIDGVGMSPSMINPGESLIFTLTITGTGPFYATDFRVLSDPTPSSALTYAAMKFVNGRDSLGNSIVDGGYQDSSFGGVVPEPGTGLLMAIGLAGLAVRRRR